MTAQETAWQTAEAAAASLAPDADVFGTVDAAGLGSSTFSVLRRAAGEARQGVLSVDPGFGEVVRAVPAEHDWAAALRADEQPADMRVVPQRREQLRMPLFDLLER